MSESGPDQVRQVQGAGVQRGWGRRGRSGWDGPVNVLSVLILKGMAVSSVCQSARGPSQRNLQKSTPKCSRVRPFMSLKTLTSLNKEARPFS